MTTIAELVDRHGSGLLHKRQLVRLGAADHHLTEAVRGGEVRRPRRGWYTTWPPHDRRFVAVRVGGRLTGASALAELGAWAWNHHPRITVSVPANAARLRWKRRVRVVWVRPEVVGRGSSWSVALEDALREAITEVPFEEAVAALDWALHFQILRLDDLERIVQGLPTDVRGIVGWVDPKCESFLESIVRTRARLAGYSVVIQRVLRTNERIDLVVNGVVGVEVDGKEYHENKFERDRRKDLEIVLDGEIPLRLTYSMIESDWASVERALGRAVAMHVRSSGGVGVAELPHSVPRRDAPRPGGRRRWRLPVIRRRGADATRLSHARPPRPLVRRRVLAPARHGPSHGRIATA
ncbi:glycyl-tRNA synthetase [Frondihabitans australicus]|nr:glycyl-tRNA synthetase [Frondihabitans australicus]